MGYPRSGHNRSHSRSTSFLLFITLMMEAGTLSRGTAQLYNGHDRRTLGVNLDVAVKYTTGGID